MSKKNNEKHTAETCYALKSRTGPSPEDREAATETVSRDIKKSAC